MIRFEYEVFENLPNVKNKLVVDAFNSLYVAGEHIKVKKQREGVISRFYDTFTGAGCKRQRMIDQWTLDGVDKIGEYLIELTKSVSLTNSQVVSISMMVNRLVEDAALNASKTYELFEELNRVKLFTKTMLDENDERISKIELSILAETEVSYVLSKWEVGKFNDLSVAERCFVVLNELAVGHFGDYVSSVSLQQKRILLKTLKNKMQVQVFKDIKMESNDSVRVVTERLFSCPNTPASIYYKNAVLLLGCDLEPDSQPLSYFSACKPKERSLLIPYISRIPLFISTMISEQKW